PNRPAGAWQRTMGSSPRRRSRATTSWDTRCGTSCTPTAAAICAPTGTRCSWSDRSRDRARCAASMRDRRRPTCMSPRTCCATFTWRLFLQRLRDLPKIVGKTRHLGMTRLLVWRAQNRGRMHRREHERRERRGHERAPLRRHLELPPEQRLRRRRPKTDDRARFHELNFRIEPRTARRDLRRVRFLVNAALAARLPFEMLDDVGDVDRRAIDAGVDERAIEQLAGRADERVAGEVFLIARLLADQHQLGLACAFAEHGLRTAQIQIAGLAVFGVLTNAVEGQLLR